VSVLRVPPLYGARLEVLHERVLLVQVPGREGGGGIIVKPRR
jgi:hypothetical protein